MARVQARKTQVKEEAKTEPKTKPQPRREEKEQTSEVILAMDIGTRSIIGMVGLAKEDKIEIIAVEKEDHTERAMVDGQIENIEKVSALAGRVKRRLEEKSGYKLSRVCVAAAGRALRTKRADFELELSGAQLIDDEIISRLEAGAITRAEEAFDADNEAAEDTRRFYLVGYTVCQYFLDQYMISNLKDHRGKHVKVDLIATFLPSEVVESLYTTMNKIGLEVASLTLEPIAAINAAIPENIRLLNLVLVDIGAGTSDIAACTGGSITGYTMATVAGDEITETIMKQYLVDFAAAEHIKARLDVEEELSFTDILGMEHKISRDEIFQCIQGTSGFLCKEIADKVLEINGSAPSALFLAGGGSKLAGLKEGLATALGMEAGRVAVAGNYFKANAFSSQYDLNNPEYATPLGIAVSSGLNMINDSFRVILNNKPAKLFRSGSFTALNLLMMNGYNFRDLLGRAGQNVTVMVNGARKVFYGTSAEPATLLINQKEGKLSDIIHAGDAIDFVPAIQGTAAKACLKDIDGAADCEDITLNGIHVPLKTPLKSGDVIHITFRKPVPEPSAPKQEGAAPVSEAGNPGQEGKAPVSELRNQEQKEYASAAEPGKLGQEGKAPVSELRNQEQKEYAPAVEPGEPEPEGTAPVSEPGKMGPEGKAPAAEPENPGPEGKAPVSELRNQEQQGTVPAVELRKPDPEQNPEKAEGDTERNRPQAGADAEAGGKGPEAEPEGERRQPDGRQEAAPGFMEESAQTGETPAGGPEPEGTDGFPGQVKAQEPKTGDEASEAEREVKEGELVSGSAFGTENRPESEKSREWYGKTSGEGRETGRRPGSALERLGRLGGQITPAMGGKNPADGAALGEPEDSREDTAGETQPLVLKSTVVFRLNGSNIELPKKEDGRPYYLMDMIQYSGIDLEHPKGVVKLTVNGAPGMFRQALAQGDTIVIEEEKR